MDASVAAPQKPFRGSATPGARRTAPVVAYIAGALALVLAGAYLAAGVISRGAPGDPVIALPAGPFGTAQDIPASFGVVAVQNVVKTNGVGAKALSGNVHGISGYVAPDKVQVRASVTLTNLLDHPIAYDPRQFRLLVGTKRKPLDEVRPTCARGPSSRTRASTRSCSSSSRATARSSGSSSPTPVARSRSSSTSVARAGRPPAPSTASIAVTGSRPS